MLGPILFLVYINDLPDDIVSQVRLFADDTAIYLALENKSDSDKLQRDLDRLQTWEARWEGTGQLVPKSTRTLVNSYPFLVNSYLSQLVPKSTRTLVYL